MDDAASTTSLPASWYPDPDDQAQLRWWDGAAWTAHVRSLPAPPPAPDPEATAIVEAFVIKTNVAEAGTWYAETGNSRPRSPQSRKAPVSVDAHDDSDDDAIPTPSWTASSFVLAFLPLIAFGVQYFLWSRGDSPGSIFMHNPVAFWIVPALLIIANPIVATLDHGALATRNLGATPSGIIGLFPPVYLVMRAISVGASSVPPLIIWCVLVLGLYSISNTFIGTFFTLVAAQVP